VHHERKHLALDVLRDDQQAALALQHVLQQRDQRRQPGQDRCHVAVSDGGARATHDKVDSTGLDTMPKPSMGMGQRTAQLCKAELLCLRIAKHARGKPSLWMPGSRYDHDQETEKSESRAAKEQQGDEAEQAEDFQRARVTAADFAAHASAVAAPRPMVHWFASDAIMLEVANSLVCLTTSSRIHGTKQLQLGNAVRTTCPRMSTRYSLDPDPSRTRISSSHT